MPIFLVMVIGWGLRQIGMLNDNFVNVANKLNFKVTLPIMLFMDISAVDVRQAFDAKYILFCAGATVVCFWSIWGLAKLLVKDNSIRGAFVQASFRSSAAVMGLAFIQNLFGKSTMGPMMIIGAVPLYNIFSVLVLTFEANDTEGENAGIRDNSKIKEAMINILKNPIIIGIVLGMIASLIHLQLPIVADKTLSSVAQLATPLALITLGAGFEGKQAIAKIKPAIGASMIKLVIQPLIFLPIAAAMGFRGEEMIGIVIMLAAPTTPSCYIMAKNMKNDGVLTASVIVLTTLIAAVTLTGWIYILKVLQYI